MKRSRTDAPPRGLDEALDECERTREAAELEAATAALRGAGLMPVNARDLIKAELPPVEWIVEDLLAARGGSSRGFKGDIIAGSKMRKTFFALQLAASVSAGVDFLGRFKVPQPRRVLYLNLELREDFTRERIIRIAEHMGADLGNLEIMTPARPYLLRNRYRDNRATGEREKVEGFEDELLEYIRGEGYALAIADPQYKLMHPEEEENTGAGLGGILRWRDRIITETGAAVLMVHHDRKSGGTDLDLTQRGAGSGYGGRDYDCRMALDAHKDGDPDHEVLECGSRVRKDPDPVTVVFDSGTLTFSADDTIPAERKTLKHEQMTPAEREEKHRRAAEAAAREIFSRRTEEVANRHEANGTKPSPVEYLMGTATFKSELIKQADIGGTACNEQTDGLLERGVLSRQGELKWGEDGQAKLKGAKLFIGLPVHVEEYRREFGLAPTGDELRGGVKSRKK